jgi:hypothetical protein
LHLSHMPARNCYGLCYNVCNLNLKVKLLKNKLDLGPKEEHVFT